MSGVYLDPIGIQLRGNHLDIMLAKITQFIRTQMKLDFSMIVYHPASDFYDFWSYLFRRATFDNRLNKQALVVLIALWWF